MKLLRDVLEAWKTEVEKKPPIMSVDDAYEALGLPRGQHHEEPLIRKSYYRLAQKYHPDKNPQGRVSSWIFSFVLSFFFFSNIVLCGFKLIVSCVFF